MNAEQETIRRTHLLKCRTRIEEMGGPPPEDNRWPNENVLCVVGDTTCYVFANAYLNRVKERPCPRPHFRLATDDGRRFDLTESNTAKKVFLKSLPPGAVFEKLPNEHYTDYIFAYDDGWKRLTSILKDGTNSKGNNNRKDDDAAPPLLAPASDAGGSESDASVLVVGGGGGGGGHGTCVGCADSFAIDDVAATRLPCGGVYCKGCLKNWCGSLREKGFKCSCSGARGATHDVPPVGAYVGLLDDKDRRTFDAERRKRFKPVPSDAGTRAHKITVECPGCANTVVVGLGARRFFCGCLGCLNPAFGYCADCLKPVHTDRASHDCDYDAAARRSLKRALVESNEGVFPCPTCGACSAKPREMCNHVTCASCMARYCAACGHAFAKKLTPHGAETDDYAHACNVRNGNMYGRIDAKKLARAYEDGAR